MSGTPRGLNDWPTSSRQREVNDSIWVRFPNRKLIPVFIPTEEQARVLQHDIERSARLQAGPGAGKSATVVALLNDLMERENPPRVRLLTFTRAATAELAVKVADHPAAGALRPSTIHSFAISVLVRNPGAGDLPSPLRIADDWEDGKVVRPSLARRLGTTPSRVKELFEWQAANWESLDERECPVPEELRVRFLGAWREHRRAFGYTRLAELPYALREALLNHPGLQGIDWELLIVDEYQDLNSCDLEVLHLLADRGCTLIGAGDEDQSIYSFRQAAPEGIRRFPDDYPGADDYVLTITKRCGQRIVNWANFVIGGDPGRPPRQLRSANDAPEGEAALLRFRNQTDEARGIAQMVSGLIRENVPASEILILVRSDHNGAFSRPIKQELQRLNIDYADPDAVKQMLAETDNRAFLARFRLIANREDSLAWATLLELEHGIGSTFHDWLYGKARGAGGTVGSELLAQMGGEMDGAPVSSARRAQELVERVVAWLDQHPAPDNLEEWGAWMIETAVGDHLPQPTAALRELLVELDDTAEAEVDLGRFIGQIAPLGKDIEAARGEAVRIMTMASAKGLTVQATIVAALENDVIPRSNVDVQEERRLLYVALTRSTTSVFATWAGVRTGPGARAGVGAPQRFRNVTEFLRDGPVQSVDGAEFVAARWPGQ